MRPLRRFAISGCALAVATTAGMFMPQRLGSHELTRSVNAMSLHAAPLLGQEMPAVAQPYRSSLDNTSCIGHGSSCELDFPAVPADKRLLVTHFDAEVFVSGSGGLTSISLATFRLADRVYPEFSAGAPVASFNVFHSSRVVEYYLDAGSIPRVNVQAAAGTVTPTSVTLTGYLMDCATGCAPIAN